MIELASDEVLLGVDGDFPSNWRNGRQAPRVNMQPRSVRRVTQVDDR
jgi:hypothetical protein